MKKVYSIQYTQKNSRGKTVTYNNQSQRVEMLGYGYSIANEPHRQRSGTSKQAKGIVDTKWAN